MSDTVIRVEGLGKKYIIGHQQQERYSALRDVISSKTKSLLKRNSKQQKTEEEFWALKDVSFEIKHGDRVGIIGRNGAGKSTLLKVLSQITEPTTGRINIRGRIASLLEVGTGFHPELTGRENIYLNGAILGMSKAEIERKFDEIVDFAEVEKFLDTPVKRYSSGMYVRLAFAVAAHLEPEILVVDEVLAVGDTKFQSKCLAKMEEAGKEGKTILFVSHNMGTLKTLCNRAFLISSGRIIKQGETADIVSQYLKESVSEKEQNGEVYWTDKATAPGGKELRLVYIRLFDEQKLLRQDFESSNQIEIEIAYEVHENIKGMRLILQIINSEGVIAFASTDHNVRKTEHCNPGSYITFCKIPQNLLNSGMYYVKLHAGCPGHKVLLNGKEFLVFNIEKSTQHGSSYPERWPGVVAPKLSWETVKTNKHLQ